MAGWINNAKLVARLELEASAALQAAQHFLAEVEEFHLQAIAHLEFERAGYSELRQDSPQDLRWTGSFGENCKALEPPAQFLPASLLGKQASRSLLNGTAMVVRDLSRSCIPAGGSTSLSEPTLVSQNAHPRLAGSSLS